MAVRSTLRKFHFRFHRRFYSVVNKTNIDLKRMIDKYLDREIRIYQMRFHLPQSLSEYVRDDHGQRISGLPFEKPPLYHFVEVDASPFLQRDIFSDGWRVLEDFLRDKPLDGQSRIAVAALERFYECKGIHEKSLRKLWRPEIAESKPAVMSLLACHFLTQLIPSPHNYYLDKYAGLDIGRCPCGCGELQTGVNFVGNHELFYGSPEIVLFSSGGSVFKPDISKSSVFRTGICEKMFDKEQMDHLEDEDYNFIEESRNQCNEEDTQQLLRQAIAVSLCHRKNLQSGTAEQKGYYEETTMIPTCGISPSGYKIAMYDSTNDILLLSDDLDLQLFETDGTIKFTAMVDLWMAIHHPLSCSGIWEDAIDQFKGTCNIQALLGDKNLQDIIDGSQWFFGIEKIATPSKIPLRQGEIARMPGSRTDGEHHYVVGNCQVFITDWIRGEDRLKQRGSCDLGARSLEVHAIPAC